MMLTIISIITQHVEIITIFIQKYTNMTVSYVTTPYSITEYNICQLLHTMPTPICATIINN